MDPSPTPTYPKPRDCKSATTYLSTLCAVVERPDHHGGDDLVIILVHVHQNGSRSLPDPILRHYLLVGIKGRS